MTGTHPPGRGRAWLLSPFVLILLALPVALFWNSAGALVDDTRAWFGGGTDQGVPTVTSVHCVGSRAGSNSSRGIGMTTYGCVIDVAAAKPAAQDDPFKTLPYDQAMEEWRRRTMAELKRVTDPANRLNRIERSLPLNRTGTRPTLRRLSADGQPMRFGVVWGAGDLVWRWVQIMLFTAMFWGLGIGLLILARNIWRGWVPRGRAAPTINEHHPSS